MRLTDQQIRVTVARMDRPEASRRAIHAHRVGGRQSLALSASWTACAIATRHTRVN